MAAYRRVYDSLHLLRTVISSGTLRSAIKYGLLARMRTVVERRSVSGASFAGARRRAGVDRTAVGLGGR